MSPWHLDQLHYFFVQSQLKKIRWKSTWTSPSLRQLDRVHLSQSASYLAVHLVMEKCLFMWKCSNHYHHCFHSLHNNREPLSPLSSPAHPPRLSYPGTHLWFLLPWLYNSTSDELSIFDWYLGTQKKSSFGNALKWTTNKKHVGNYLAHSQTCLMLSTCCSCLNATS